MGTSCSDVCELVQEMLNGLGFKFDDNEASHDDMIQALYQCSLIKTTDHVPEGSKQVVNNAENRAKLANAVVDSWDMTTLFEHGVMTTEESYQKDDELFQRDWEDFFSSETK